MNFSVKKIMFFIGALLVFSLFAMVLLVQLNKDEIQAQLIKELNKQIETKITGDVSISLFENFPGISLVIDDVQIKGSIHELSEKLLEAESMALNLHFWSLLTKEYKVNSINIKNGHLLIRRDEKGQINYRFAKKKGANQDTAVSILSIDQATLNNVQVDYIDAFGQSGKNIRFFVSEGQLKGNFSVEHLDLQARIKAKVDDISFDENSYLTNKKIELSLNLTSETQAGIFIISEGDLLLNDNHFLIDGTIVSNKTKDHVDLVVEAEGNNLKRLISILPEKNRSTIEDFSGSGKYNLSAKINGDVTNGATPNVRIDFSIIDGKIKSRKINGELKNVQLEGYYTNGSKRNARSSILSIPKFSVSLKKNDLLGTLQVANFVNPKFTVHLNGIVNLSNIAEMIIDTNLTQIDGSVRIDNFHFIGRKSDLDRIAKSNLTGSGSLDFDDVNLTYNQVKYKKINGKLSFDKDRVDAENFMMQFLNTDLEFTGSLVNFVEYIFNLTKNKESEGTPLIAEGTLLSQQIDLSEIIKGYSMREENGIKTSRNAPGKKITLAQIHNMEGNLKADIAMLVQDELEFENIITNLTLQPGQILIDKLNCNSMKGNVTGSGMVQFKQNNTINLSLDCRAEEIDIKTMFYQCNNFGQQVLNDDHLNGQLTTDLRFNATWENFNQLREDLLTADADIEISNGRLVNFEPINVLSRYIKLQELQDIQFSTIKNQIHIRNRTIEIPTMEIESSVLNLTTHGKHNFDNWIDYHFKVNLKALLAKKFNRKKDKANANRVVEGGASIFISMKGPMMNPDVRYDKNAVKDKIKKDFREEKEELKELFTKEKTKPNPAENAKAEEKIFFEIDEEPEYIEWEEDTIGEFIKN